MQNTQTSPPIRSALLTDPTDTVRSFDMDDITNRAGSSEALGSNGRDLGRLGAIGLAEGNIGHGHRINAYQSHIIEGIITAARRQHQDVVHFYGHPSDQIERSVPAYKRRCDGLLHFVSELADGSYAAIRDAQIPFVTIGGTPPDGKGACVDIDNIQAARDATRHLIELGHRRIAILNGCDAEATGKREAGYRLALQEAGLPIVEQIITSGGSSYLSGTDRTQKLMALPAAERPTGMVCFNDVVALGALRAASELRLSAPEDLSVVGFDDIVEASLFRPALTTIRQPLRLIGERSVELLLEILAGAKPPDYHDLVHHELVIRGSTAPPRSRD